MALKRIFTGDQNLQKIQDNVDQALVPLQQSPLVGGKILSGIVLSSGSNSITHGLGQIPSRWVITDINAAANIYRSAWDSKTITLNASAGCTISLWVR